ncbi:uncharacterized protein LOC110827415 isoform X2 [Zootermopsis nevadensis]|nr:uncharacterized protein LOC110827415 isoform X2 [Zootermopsis nevadensis]XP_021914753.1 uncharacterized protein LOC110827415 isoform X2 [Zootermopsis nevadensis]
MFLVLNANLSVKEKLVEDINCGHIIDCVPNLSKELLVKLVWGLSLHKYACESIIYCPLSLGAELLDIFFDNLSSVEPVQALPRVEELSKAVYCKYIQLEHLQVADMKYAKWKLFTYFKNLMQYFVKPDLKELGCISTQDMYRFAGFAMKSILSLMTDYLKLYLNLQEHEVDVPEVYDISLPELCGGVEKEIEVITSNNFINELLYTCKVNFCAITVDIWLFWAECNVDEARTLQNEISEMMYSCSELLKKVRSDKVKFPLAGELITMLSSMAVKPREEDDEIREADIELIIKNVSDKSKSQKKWFKALLALNEVISDNCADCLKNNLYLAEYEDVKAILEKTIATIESKHGDREWRDKIKRIGLDSLKQLALQEQVEIVQWFFKKFGTSVDFLTDSFHVVATEVFNKAVKRTGNENKFLSDFVGLCVESPVEVITRVLQEGLKNSKQIVLMVEVLECLNPIYGAFEAADMGAASGNEKMIIVTCLLNEAMKNDLNDQEKSNFVNFVIALINHNIVNGSAFIRRSLLPALYNSLCVKTWSLLLLWLEVLRSFTDGRIKNHTDVPECPLLVMLAQVLEVSRWNLITFSPGAVSVCEEALLVVRTVMKMFLSTKTVEDKEVKWLQMKLDGFLSPLNKSYFSQLWSKFGRDWAPAPYNINTFLLDVIQNDEFSDETGKKVVELFRGSENKENLFHFSFSKLLPLCTPTEWKILAKRMKEINICTSKVESPGPQMHLFADSVLLFLFVIKREGIQENECALSCLDYSIRNLGLVLKEEINTQLKSLPTEEQAKILIKILHILGQLPPSIKDTCSILMLNVLVELLPEIFSDYVQEKEDAAGSVETSSFLRDIAISIGVLGNGEPLQILSRKLLECMAIGDAHLSCKQKQSIL